MTDEIADESPETVDEGSEDMEEGCLFPGECLMVGIHLKVECHTVEMAVDASVQEILGDCKTCGGTGELEQWPSMHDMNPGIEIIACPDCSPSYDMEIYD